MARRNHVEAEFMALHDIALKLGLGELPGKNCMKYKPTYNWVLSAITVYTYQDALWIHLRPQNFPRKPWLTNERIREPSKTRMNGGCRPASSPNF